MRRTLPGVSSKSQSNANCTSRRQTRATEGTRIRAELCRAGRRLARSIWFRQGDRTEPRDATPLDLEIQLAPATFLPMQTHLCNGGRFSRMISIWFFRAYGPVIVEFVGVVLVAVGARGLAWREGSGSGNIRSQYDQRHRSPARGGSNILQATEASSNGRLLCKPAAIQPSRSSADKSRLASNMAAWRSRTGTTCE